MMNNKRVYPGVVGTMPTYQMNRLRKDTDKDCKPNDQNKPGFFQNVKQKVIEVHEEHKERKKIERAVAKEERIKQAKETAVYREKIRGQREREQIKKGGTGLSGFTSGLSNFSNMVVGTQPKHKKKDDYFKRLGGMI